MNLKAGLRRKTQKIFLILYHKAEALDKGKEEKTANQNPNWMKPKPPKSSGKISTVLTMKSLIYNFHMSNEAHDWVSSLSGRDFASKCVSVITSLAPQYLGLPFIISSQTQLVCFQILALCCKPQMYSRFQTQEVMLICWHSRMLFLFLLQSQKWLNYISWLFPQRKKLLMQIQNIRNFRQAALNLQSA